MDTEALFYTLPEACIAQQPAQPRDASRLMVVCRQTGSVTHATFRDLGRYLPKPCGLLRNCVQVLKARLQGIGPKDQRLECFLLHPDEGNTWWCLLRPGRKAHPGYTFRVLGPSGPLATAEVLQRNPQGFFAVRFGGFCTPEASVVALAQAAGQVPLPPYIRNHSAEDSTRYQTVYAQPQYAGAVAAPTAGLHFTPSLLQSLADDGIVSHDLVLHVGLGTFQPIKVAKLQDHAMHSEFYSIPAATQDFIRHPAGHCRVAVGTTTLRATEHYARTVGLEPTRPGCSNSPESSPYHKLPHTPHSAAAPLQQGPHSAWADLWLYPPAAFLATDALITNFHLPRSTLLALVAAFLDPQGTQGLPWLKDLYAQAIGHGYRFYSYGDAMLIV
jgi:S-adenosylmethionine:tRNA ribosyltransferase-isomerase